jgi:1-acyl-sn-glycerol-3-phosphate acyltransferase
MSRMPFLYRLGWTLFHVAFRVWFRWRIFHADRVPREGPVILASSHSSYLDPPLVGTALSRMCHYMARASLFRNPLFGWVLRQVGVMPVDRDGGSAAGLKTVLGRLRLGSALVLFPEGTRSPDGQLQKPRSGVGLIVLKSGAPVVPVRIRGSFEAWGRHRRFPRPVRITVSFGSPIRFEKQLAESAACDKDRLKGLYREVTDEIMAAIAAL